MWKLLNKSERIFFQASTQVNYSMVPIEPSPMSDCVLIVKIKQENSETKGVIFFVSY